MGTDGWAGLVERVGRWPGTVGVLAILIGSMLGEAVLYAGVQLIDWELRPSDDSAEALFEFIADLIAIVIAAVIAFFVSVLVPAAVMLRLVGADRTWLTIGLGMGIFLVVAMIPLQASLPAHAVLPLALTSARVLVERHYAPASMSKQGNSG